MNPYQISGINNSITIWKQLKNKGESLNLSFGNWNLKFLRTFAHVIKWYDPGLS
jgi:hypothetical protein